MSMLAALVRAYERLEDAPRPGYSVERISFVVTLAADGSPVGQPMDWRLPQGKKLEPRREQVPAAFKRPGVTPRAFFLWDNSAYALGVTGSETKGAAARFATFRARHIEELDGAADAGLMALRRFVERWDPAQFAALGWPEEMKDANIAFRLEHDAQLLHARPAAQAMVEAAAAGGEDDGAGGLCLVTGRHGPIARLHPPIKGVDGAQSMGASLVSFNLDAFTSYGHDQGDNAPVSVAAAEAYVGALNRFLRRDSGHRLSIGDASVVFWADASDAEAAALAEATLDEWSDPGSSDEAEAKPVGAVLEKIREGRPQEIDSVLPGLSQGVRFFILGLAPNNARLSVRYWQDTDFGTLARNLSRHARALDIDPPPRQPYPPLWHYLVELAPQRKRENIPAQVAGDWVRSILAGRPYPHTLRNTVLMRIRSDKRIDALRAAMLRGCLITQFPQAEKESVSVSLDPQNTEAGYVLGRLFAVFEYAQVQAMPGVNASIRDKFYGTASATPRNVFPTLQRGLTHHLAKLRKDRPGQAWVIDRTIAEIAELATPDTMALPRLVPRQQALFAIGYYHQRHALYTKRSAEPDAASDASLEDSE